MASFEEPLISMKSISKSISTKSGQVRTIFSDLSIEIYTNDKICIKGPNGAGKSTILRMILGVDTPTRGILRKSKRLDEAAICYLPQDYRNALFPWLTVEGNLKLYKQSVNLEKLLTALNDVGLLLESSKYIYELSGGEQQILLLILALLREPELILADEPFSAIDVYRKVQVRNLLKRYLDGSNATLIFISHDAQEISDIATREILLSGISENPIYVNNV